MDNTKTAEIIQFRGVKEESHRCSFCEKTKKKGVLSPDGKYFICNDCIKECKIAADTSDMMKID